MNTKYTACGRFLFTLRFFAVFKVPFGMIREAIGAGGDHDQALPIEPGADAHCRGSVCSADDADAVLSGAARKQRRYEGKSKKSLFIIGLRKLT